MESILERTHISQELLFSGELSNQSSFDLVTPIKAMGHLRTGLGNDEGKRRTSATVGLEPKGH